MDDDLKKILDNLISDLTKAQKDFFNSRGDKDRTYGIEVKEEKERAVITAYAEVGYNTLDKMCNALDEVVEQYSSAGYFEPESPGRAELFLYYKWLNAEKVDWSKKFKELRTKDSLPSYEVVDAKGKKVNKGDKLTSFRGDEWIFEGCWHPRKITAKRKDNAKYRISDYWVQEFYPGVFGLKIILGDNKVEDAKLSGYAVNYDKLVLNKKKNEYGEYVVRAYKGKDFIEESSYHTEDWDDAVQTIKAEADRAGLEVVIVSTNRIIAVK